MRHLLLCLDLFLTFFKIGAFTFGGGYAMLPMIQSEVVGRGWISNDGLINFIAVSESTPGPFAVNIATYVGRIVGGISGAFFATLGVVLPSFIIILIVARFFDAFKKNRIIEGCMTGLRAAVIGLIGASLFSIAKTVLFPNGIRSVAKEISSGMFPATIAILAVMLFLSFKKHVHPILVICLSAAAGIAAGYALGLP